MTAAAGEERRPGGTETDPDWIFCQIGAREHYVLPRAMQARGRLRALYTDLWCPPDSLTARLPGGQGRKLRDRFTSEIPADRVQHFTAPALIRDGQSRVRRRALWDEIVARDTWFGRRAAARLQRLGHLAGDPRPVVFSYSYGAREIFRAARAAGCRTVLGQIDPGPAEEDIVAQVSERHAAFQPHWNRAPAAYWDAWRQECELADVIVANSRWSRDCLIGCGVPADRIRVIPLAYQGQAATDVARPAVTAFDAARPLRVLFLGSLIVRKGIVELLDAARRLADAPVEFHLVGHPGIAFPADDLSRGNVILHGPVSRSAVQEHYRAADIFILPTHSDGFGLTMLEAMANGLPVLASRHCGDAVVDGRNGWLLPAVSGGAIADAIRQIIAAPERLPELSAAARATLSDFSPDRIAAQLDAAIAEAAPAPDRGAG